MSAPEFKGSGWQTISGSFVRIYLSVPIQIAIQIDDEAYERGFSRPADMLRVDTVRRYREREREAIAEAEAEEAYQAKLAALRGDNA